MTDWFTIEKLDKHTYIISEYRHWEETYCYLLNGTQYSLLIDTGLGICNIYDAVTKLTDKPIIAVATHIHWDHIGGHKYFPNFYAHKEELNWLQGEFPLPLDLIKKMVVDRCDLPKNYDIDTYELFQGTPVKLLDDGDSIDIGGRRIQVLHTPGHSPGHHTLEIQPEILIRMRKEFRQLLSEGKLHHGSGTFDFGDWAVWM